MKTLGHEPKDENSVVPTEVSRKIFTSSIPFRFSSFFLLFPFPWNFQIAELCCMEQGFTPQIVVKKKLVKLEVSLSLLNFPKHSPKNKT